MKQKAVKKICGITCFLGFMFVFGTVGALENDTITLGQGILQACIGLAVFAGAGYLGGFIE
ncbi:MAG: hypothetical protein ABFD66_03040 [Smithella sp.]